MWLEYGDEIVAMAMEEAARARVAVGGQDAIRGQAVWLQAWALVRTLRGRCEDAMWVGFDGL